MGIYRYCYPFGRQESGATVAQVKLEHNQGWAEDHPQFALKSLNKFIVKHSEDYDISVDTRRDGYITYIANVKEAV